MSTSVEEDELLVTGYIRKESMNLNIGMASDIIGVCLLFYHIEIYWIEVSQDTRIINDEQTIIEQICRYGSSYGSVLMPSTNNDKIYEYSVVLKTDCHSLTIGIAEDISINKYLNTWFWGKEDTKNYAFACWDNKIHSWETGCYNGFEYGCKCEKKGDIVTVIYDSKLGTLSFTVNGKQFGNAFDNIYKQEYLCYRIAVDLAGSGDSIELVSLKTKIST
eukprot:48492_1